ncbi:hypothetical protein MUO83_02845 [Candidatus Bathyarchaeota archaeon]|jgi:hypothetical protein|nr:hypothetical protein [Candidatus Bathyarchaeota archaeon]
MTHLYIDPIFVDKEDETLYKSKRIRVDGKSFDTPIISYDMTVFRSNDRVAPPTKGLNEIYQLMGTEKVPIGKLMSNMKAEKDFDVRLQTKFGRTDSAHEVNIGILESESASYPSGTELDYVLKTASIISDIVPIPNFHSITANIDSDSQFLEYTKFLENVISNVESYKDRKPIMGVIPKLSYTNTEKLVEFYIDKGLNAFYVDFAARNSITAQRDFLHVFSVLHEHDLIEKSFVYAFNVDAGRLSKNATVVNARDILSYGFGFDAIGRKHRRVKASSETWRRINTLPNRVRLFNRYDYGYHKILEAEKIKEIYPSDSCISLEKLLSNFYTNVQELRRCENMLNSEQLGLEANNLKYVIKNDKPTEYLADKTYVKPIDLKTITRFRKSLSTSAKPNWENWLK